MKNIVVFASGSGTNFQSIIDAVQRGDIDARLAGLVTNKPGIPAIARAQKSDIPVRILNPADFSDKQDYSNHLLKQLLYWKTDLIVLAGYLKKIPSAIVRHFDKRILNIHPALLPKYGGKGFYGLNVHAAVLESGDKESGCTVHVVTDDFDEGPILAQVKVDVHETDSPEDLAERVLKQEHKLLPEVIKQYLLTL